MSAPEVRASEIDPEGATSTSRRPISRGRVDLVGLARAVDRRLLAPVPWYRLVEVHTLVAAVIGLRLVTRDWALVAQRPAVLTGGPVADADFTSRFEAKAGRVPTTPFVLQTHDAVTALLRATEATLVDNGDGSLSIDRTALADALRNGRFAGLSGSITFDEFGDRRGETAPELGLRVYRIENGGLVLIE